MSDPEFMAFIAYVSEHKEDIKTLNWLLIGANIVVWASAALWLTLMVDAYIYRFIG